jgi:RNA-directed DNA polymerase
VSLLGWLKHKVFGGGPQRDVSQLETDADALDTLTEKVDVSGGPLKPHHRRRALRDPRLLPKPPASARLIGKRKKVLSGPEAARLFGATMLTRNRQLRDLLPDEEQLVRLGLPVWRSEADIASALGLTPGQLRHFSIHRERERTPHYVTFAIKKRSGGERIIMAPKCRLKAIQRSLLPLLVEKLPVTNHAHGFRRGRSIRSGAEPHVGRRVVVHLDLQDFFPTVTFARVRGFLIACGYGYPVATTLAVLVTEAQRQPVEVNGEVFHVPVGQRHCVQGAPTSPGLCNALVAKCDGGLAGLAGEYG